jgi:hypothetical protein
MNRFHNLEEVRESTSVRKFYQYTPKGKGKEEDHTEDGETNSE